MIRLLLSLVLLLPLAARAEDGGPLDGTLRTVKDTGLLRIGYRESAPPFSFLNKGGQPVGFSLDLCRGIAQEVGRALSRDVLEPDAPAWQSGIRIVFTPVAAGDRLPKLVSGAIDLECGSTTANAERAKTIAFSPVFFLAGTKLLVSLRGLRIRSYQDLAGKTVVAGAGTTNAAVMRRLAAGVTPPIVVTEAANLEDAYAMLARGEAAAFASDDVLLSGLVATHADGKNFAVVGDYLSYEPYAIGFRRDDPAFAALIRDGFARMAEEGFLSRSYDRWFVERLPDGSRLGLPMSPHLTEMYRALGQPD